jgi:signal transduction histidine kinase
MVLKQRTFHLITIVVAILITGLVVVQIYWIRTAFALAAIRRTDMINRSLKRAAAETEKQVFSYNLFIRSYMQSGQGLVILRTDTSGKASPDTIRFFNAFPYPNKPDTCFYSTSLDMYSVPTLAEATFRFEYLRGDSAGSIIRKNDELQQLNINNYKSILDEMRPISERLNVAIIDSVLLRELKREGIHEQYVFGLRRKGGNRFEYVSDTTNLSQLLVSPFSVTLFEDRPFRTPYILQLSINDAQWLHNKNILLALNASVLIILLLASAFIYFFRTVIRQKKLSEMKTDFINNMTHEFMTPVTNIGLALETLEKSEQDRTRQQIMNVIGTENDHLKENIQKILQVAVLEEGTAYLNPGPVNLHELLQRLERSFEIAIREQQGMLVFSLHATDPVIIADETHLINLFYNLLDNAIKYASAAPLQVHVDTWNTGRKLIVQVRDNGIGMNPEVQRHIFNRFYRASNGTRHDVKGFGLGLTYVKSIADAHGADIGLESVPGKGSIFTITFKQS